MDRRRYLVTAGQAATVGLAGLAGCNAPDGEEDGNGGAPADGEEPVDGNETMAGGETTAGNETAAGNETGNATDGEGAPQDVPSTVDMVTEGSNYYFDPIGLFVEPGEEITWRIESGSHSSTAYAEGNQQAQVTRIPEGAESWNSGTLSEQGATFSHTFEVTGTYDYYCIPHKTLGMVGRLVVGEPGDVEGDPPDGEVPSEQRIVEEGAISYEAFSG